MAKPTADEITARARELAGQNNIKHMEIEEEDDVAITPQPSLNGHAITGNTGNRQTRNTGTTEDRKTVKPKPARAAKPAKQRPLTAPAAAADTGHQREELVAITISVPKTDKRRSRSLENRLEDGRDVAGLKGKIGPSLIFRMSLDLLEQLEEDELFSLALKNATYQP